MQVKKMRAYLTKEVLGKCVTWLHKIFKQNLDVMGACVFFLHTHIKLVPNSKRFDEIPWKIFVHFQAST